MNTFLKFEDFVSEDKKPRVGHTVKRGYYKDDPPDIGLYSKGGRDAMKGTGYSDKEKAEYTVKVLDELMSKGENVWAMSIATTMETRAKKHPHQTDGMRDAMKIFRKWIDANKKSESIDEEEGKTLFHPGNDDAIKGTGYKDKAAAEKTISIINKLKKKDHRHAMSIATTMENRAKTHKHRTPEMEEAAKIFRKWIDANKKTESVKESQDFLYYDEFLFEKKWNKDVKSSHLTSMKYDSETEILEIEFHNGAVYQYEGVPKDVYKDLAQERNILQKIGKGIAKGARKLFGKSQVDEGTYGTRFWDLIRRGGYSYKKIQ